MQSIIGINSASFRVPPKPIVTGGTLYSDSTYYYRKFTSSGTLTVSEVPLSPIDIILIGGGGGSSSGGGGGGGIYDPVALDSYTITVPIGSTTVTIGAGGAVQSKGGDTSCPVLRNGGLPLPNPAYGGGQGGLRLGPRPSSTNIGGGGGGGNGYLGGFRGYGQGASGAFGASDYAYGGGGGGGWLCAQDGGTTTTVDGYNVQGSKGGDGCNAYATWASVTSSGADGGYFAGGGSGGNSGYNLYKALAGGLGGGGGASSGRGNYSQAGIANTGGGGGGIISWLNGGTGQPGGSGIVIIRYLKSLVD